MINNSSDPAGGPVMRTVYLRASTQTSAVVPPATDGASSTTNEAGLISLVSRPPAANPSATRLMAMESPERSDGSMQAFAWQTAQAMLADPLQTMRTQQAPMAQNVTALMDDRVD